MLDYKKIKQAADKYYDEYLKQHQGGMPDDIEKSVFNELVINILNQYVLDSTYTFKERDYDFIDKYNIEVDKLINFFKKYID